MAKKLDKSEETDVRGYRLKLSNIEFLNEFAKLNSRAPAQQLNLILEELRNQQQGKTK